jgi:hypothetical protein
MNFVMGVARPMSIGALERWSIEHEPRGDYAAHDGNTDDKKGKSEVRLAIVLKPTRARICRRSCSVHTILGKTR